MKNPLVSVVITAYKRLHHLQRTVDTLLACCTYPGLELILCDDGSPRDVQEQMRSLPFDVFIFARENRGLGASVNRGLRAARGAYILYLQDDWVCTRRSDFVQEGIEAIESVPRLGLVRLTGPNAAFEAFETMRTPSGLAVLLPLLGRPDSYQGIYVYSQNPHLKTRDFHDRLGYFAEGLRGTQTEDEFCRRFLEQNQYRIGTIQCHEGLFAHIGDDISYFRGKGRWRQNWRTRLNASRPTRVLVKAYDRLPENVRLVLRGTPSRAWQRQRNE